MDPRLEKLMKDTVHFLKEDLEDESLSYDCQLKKDCLIKRIQHIWNEIKYDAGRRPSAPRTTSSPAPPLPTSAPPSLQSSLLPRFDRQFEQRVEAQSPSTQQHHIQARRENVENTSANRGYLEPRKGAFNDITVDSDFDDDVYEDVDIPANQQIQPNFKEYIIKIPAFKAFGMRKETSYYGEIRGTKLLLFENARDYSAKERIELTGAILKEHHEKNNFVIKEKEKLNSRHVFFHQRKDIMNKWIQKLINAIAYAANPILEENELSEDEQSNRLIRRKSTENILGGSGFPPPRMNSRSKFQSCQDLIIVKNDRERDNRLRGFHVGGSNFQREGSQMSNSFPLKPKVGPKPNITMTKRQHQPAVDSKDSELKQVLERRRMSMAQ